ncbi:tail protein X [Pseudomonas aeruginosa]|jgi:phage tail protein X|uniref:tail protein X n=1 Tax=Pseudomonas aeruginosa TaxID=287 RepID=UPI00204337E5|nr:tail protein X [Pseudomonas aeruginosa]HBN7642444.1 tail protein X [Pseudomonas aeruginosa]HBN7783258.1 tail protein X [Pseudomonas aeruginosa]HBN7804129.1 tail protein X [Pseudomonas aeruginosa]HBN7838180.1 tail protein X [Pseudomonas aeruginosa]
MTTVIANQGDTVDAICWRYYGRTAGVTEAVLDSNPGLADLGPVIPHGTAVTLPDAAPQAEQRQVVNLWD